LIRRALTLLAVGSLSACATPYLNRGEGAAAGVAAISRGYSNDALQRVSADMDPAMLALAARHAPGRRTDYWGRTPGWETLDLTILPTLGVVLEGADARAVNALKRGGLEQPPPARPFVLRASKADRAQALHCLTQAIYYEAATEPLKGQQAVAQTVINRLRHPGYPKSICGVVFEGAMRTTGCQFSFTCDGSLARAPAPGLWKRAEGVARKALNGYVARHVGTATHYHADYVAPYWAPTLYKITQVGAHIFYRWTGPAGEPRAFNGRYQGGERNLTRAILQGIDDRIQGDQLIPLKAVRTVTLGPAGEVRTYTVEEPARPGGPPQVRAAGTLTASRRAPTPEEIARINEKLKALEPDAPVATAPAETPQPAFTGNLPIGETAPKE
jgi:spore germination cell wall hydrolase CwlJ-like protein